MKPSWHGIMKIFIRTNREISSFHQLKSARFMKIEFGESSIFLPRVFHQDAEIFTDLDGNASISRSRTNFAPRWSMEIVLYFTFWEEFCDCFPHPKSYFVCKNVSSINIWYYSFNLSPVTVNVPTKNSFGQILVVTGFFQILGSEALRKIGIAEHPM